MKKIMNFLMMCAILVACTSCKNEVEDLFDRTATQRIEDANKHYNDIFKSASNGWIMYFYGDRQYGGYNVLMKFHDDATVTIANERIYDAQNKTFTAETSHYKLEQSAGAILSFDDYNTVFHYLSDPVNPDGIGTNGVGFGGDLEYRIISATNERIELLGKKTLNKIVMVPVPAGMGWDEYLNKVKAIEADMTSANVVVTINKTDSIPTATNSPYRRLTFTVEEGGNKFTLTAPYIVTLEGFKFYSPVELKDGKTVEQFTYVPGAMAYPEASDATVELNCIVPPLNEQLVKGWWYFYEDGMSATNAAMWKTYAEAVKASQPTWTYLRYVQIGTYTYSNTFGLTGSNSYNHHYNIKYTLEGENKITFEKVTTFAGLNGAYFLRYWGKTLAPCIAQFTEVHYTASNGTILDSGGTAAGQPHTFTLETDNLKAPSYIKMTREDGEVFTVTPTVKSYPFGQGN